MVEGVELQDVVLGALLPAAVAGAVLAAALLLPARRAQLRGLAGALALAAGVCSGYFALDLGPFYKAAPGNHWLPHLTLLALPAGWLAGSGRPARAVCSVVAVSAFLAALPLEPYSAVMRLFWGVVLGYVSFVSASALIYARISGATTALAMALTGSAAALVLLEAGLARLTQVAGLLVACGAAAAAVFALLDRDAEKRLVRGMTPGFAVMLSGLMLTGRFNAGRDIAPDCYVLVGLAPAALLVTRVGAIERLPALARSVAALGTLAVPLVVAACRARWA